MADDPNAATLAARLAALRAVRPPRRACVRARSWSRDLDCVRRGRAL